MAQMSCALARVRRTRGVDLLPDSIIVQQLSATGIVWRERLLTPVVMVRLFLMQMLFGNTSITHLRQLSGIDFAPASYCAARIRLPLQLLRRLLRWTIAQANAGTRALGPRVWVVDCSSFSMPDTSALRKRFGLPRGRGCKEGVSYPIAKVMALLDHSSGCFMRLIAGPLYRHEASGVIRLHRRLRAGDILLGDRAFCSFVHVALLSMRGVVACFRLHQRRHSVRGGVERWQRPKQRPAWCPPNQFQSLPQWIDVRIVRYTVRRSGYRMRHLAIATTQLDEQLWPDEKIAELYGHRWEIEGTGLRPSLTCFDHLKTTMRMSVLKCQTIAGVQRELMMYLIAYNLIRLAVLRFALANGQSVSRVSFVDAMRWLAMRTLGLMGVANLRINPPRPGRRQLRVIRRRMKEYDLLTEPRQVRMTRENQA